MSDPHISHAVPINAQAIKLIQKEAAKERAVQVESAEDLTQYFETSSFNPLRRSNQFKELNELRTQSPKGEKKEGSKSLQSTAESYQNRNYELNAKTLLILHQQMQGVKTREEVLEKLLSIYSDPSLADEALDFLIETATPKQKNLLAKAKEKLNQDFEREIKAGRNMGTESRAFAKEGLGSATSLRDLYREITGKVREPLQMFQELTEQFTYGKLRKVIAFLLHSLGADLKSKNASISHAYLKQLIDNTRSLQGVLGVFRFFQSRMELIQSLFAAATLLMPQGLNFETLSKVFIKLLAERYISPEKIAKTAQLLGISEEVAAQIIIYAQMRDAVRQIAPRYYRNQQHKEDFLKALIAYLEELDDELEEEEEEEEEK